MLVAMRSRAGGIVVKILLIFLAATFALWGIGDIFRSSRETPVAVVEGVKITPSEFKSALDMQTERLRSYLGDGFSPELTKNLNLPRQVLENLINSILLDKEAEAYGLRIGDDIIAAKIRTTPGFQGVNNQFDRAMFQEALRANQMSEQEYVSLEKKGMAANLLITRLTGVQPVLPSQVDALYQVRHEQRTAEILTIPAAQIGDIPTPTDADLQAFYKDNASQFMAPEYRTLSFVTLTTDAVSKNVKITNEEIQQEYTDRIADFKKPERRKINQMLFDNEEEAKKAHAALTKGQTFTDVAKSAPIQNKDSTTLGLLKKEEIPQEAADAIFALKVNEITAPIKTSFGWHVFQVTEIQPETISSLEDVKEDIRKELATHKAEESLYKLSTQLEDSLAGGATLEQAADAIGMKAQTAGPLNTEGKLADGTAAAIPNYDNFLKTAFSQQEKILSPLTQSNSGAYFLVRVDSILPPRTKALDEVRGAAMIEWKKQEQNRRIKQLADDTVKELRSGKSLEDIRQKTTVGSRESGPLTRGQSPNEAEIPLELVNAAFNKPAGEFTDPLTGENGDIIIARVKSVISATQTESNGQEAANAKDVIRGEVENQVGNELAEQYLRHLRTKYTVKVNDDVLRSIAE